MNVFRKICFAVGAVVLAAASVSTVRAADAPALVRVATTPTESGAAVYYAQELGLFRRANLDVQIQQLGSGAAVAAGVASGTIDIAQGSLPSLASAHERHIPFVLVAPGAMYSAKAPTSVLVVAKNSTAHTGKDLNGKTIGNNALKNIGEIAVDAWVEKTGGDVSTLKIVEIPLAEIEAALAAGRIDAGVLVEPGLGKALAGSNVRLLAPAYTAIAPEFMINAYFANASWAKDNADVLRRFDEAVRAAGHWANDPANRQRSGEILEKYMKIQITPKNTRVTYAESLDPARIQPVIDASARYHALSASFPAREFILTGAR